MFKRRIYMNHKSMVLAALLFPVFCHSQSNEERVVTLDERITTVEAKVRKQMLKIVLLEKKDNATLRKTIKTIHANCIKEHLYNLLVWTSGYGAAHYMLIFYGLSNSRFPDLRFFIATITYFIYIT